MVRSLAAIGLRQEHICEVLRLRSPKTLRKHFAAELRAGHAEAMGTVTRVAYDMATSGKYPAMTMFWLKTHAGWSEGMEIEITGEEVSASGPGAELIFVGPESEAEPKELTRLDRRGTRTESLGSQYACGTGSQPRGAGGGRSTEDCQREEDSDGQW